LWHQFGTATKPTERKAKMRKARGNGGLFFGSLHGLRRFGWFLGARARSVTWLSANRALWRSLLAYAATTEKFVDFGVDLFSLGDQLLRPSDLAFNVQLASPPYAIRTYASDGWSSPEPVGRHVASWGTEWHEGNYSLFITDRPA